MCARFVQHAIEKDRESAEILAKIAGIGLLTEVVQDFVKPIDSVDATDLAVYLDAPVAMELLGLSGAASRENTAPLVAELIRMGASVRIYGQSVEEIAHNLRAVLSNPRPTGPTAEAILRREVLREYVVSAANDPVHLLEKHGVQTRYRTLEEFPGYHKFFTSDQWEELYGRLGYAENPHARKHDADITALTVRQRQGHSSPDLFRSRAVVITRNGLLAQIVRSEGYGAATARKDIVPPVVHRRVMATAMWLRTGLGVNNLTIPKRMLLATCERVLAIRPNVVETVKRLTDAMGDERMVEQLDLLLSQDRSAQVLMDKTLGLSNVITDQNFPLLWKEMLEPHLEEEREKGREAVTKEKNRANHRLTMASQVLERERIEREREVNTIAALLHESALEDRDAIQALCVDALRTLRRRQLVRRGIAGVLSALSALVIFLETARWVRLSSFTLTVLFGYLTITGGKLLSTGISSGEAMALLERRAEQRRMVSKLRRIEVTWSNGSFEVEDKAK